MDKNNPYFKIGVLEQTIKTEIESLNKLLVEMKKQENHFVIGWINNQLFNLNHSLTASENNFKDWE